MQETQNESLMMVHDVHEVDVLCVCVFVYHDFERKLEYAIETNVFAPDVFHSD